MLKDIKEKYNTIKALTRIEDMLLTKGVTKKNFCHKELFYVTTEMKSFASHCTYIVFHKISLDLMV